MVATATKVFPVTTVRLSEDQFYWLTTKAHKDRITPSQRVGMLVQQAIEKEADLAKHGNEPEYIPVEMADASSVTVTLESSVLRKVQALAQRRNMSVSRVVNLAAELLVSTRK